MTVLLLAGVMTLALFFSGFFVFLTPLPLLYAALKKGDHAFSRVIFLTFIIVVLIYSWVLLPLVDFYGRHPQFIWMFPIPGMNLVNHFPHPLITTLGVSLYLFFGGVAFFLKKAILRGASYEAVLGAGSILFFLVATLLFYGSGLFYADSPLTQFSNYMSRGIDEVISLQKASELPVSEIIFWQENKEAFVYYFVLFLPSFGYGVILFIFVLNLYFGKKIAWLAGVPPELSLNQWKFSFYGVWAVILSMALLLGNVFFFKKEIFFITGANILLVLAFVYFLQGCAIVSFFFEKKNIRPLSRFLLLAVLFLFLHTIGPMFVLLGFFDSWIDFREKMKSRH